MTTNLHISHSLSLPLDLVTSTQAILARKRSGKSYCASVMAEEMLIARQQIAVIDPTGAWHGLKSSADGLAAGFPVVVFGGEHADVPLDSAAGEMLARTMIDRGFSAIFDVSLLGVAEAIRFVSAFINELFRVNREAMHLFIDEADSYAPEKPYGEETKSLAAVKRIVKQGGIRGIGVTMITQRPQQIAKSVLSQIDLLTILRMGHPLEIGVVTDWIKSEIGVELAAEVKQALPRMPVGTAYICSAQWNIGQRVEIRKRITFNSGATPKPGQKRVQPAVLAQIDIEKLGQEIRATVEKAKADDPKELKKRIAELERLDSVANNGLLAARDIRVQELEAHARQLNQQINTLVTRDGQLTRAIDTIRSIVAFQFEDVPPTPSVLPALPTKAAPAVPAQERPASLPPMVKVEAEIGLTAPQMRILIALAKGLAIKRTHLTRTWTGFLADASPKSSSFINNLGSLRSRGLIEYPSQGNVALTAEGISAVGGLPAPMTESELHSTLLGMITVPQQRIMQELLGHRGEFPIARSTLAARAAASPTSSSFINNLGALRSLGLLDYPAQGAVVASYDLFL